MGDLILFLILLIIAATSGTIIEKVHYKKIKTREIKYFRYPIVSFGKNVESSRKIEKAELVSGSVVLAADGFKSFIFSLKNMFGGRIVPYESVLDRARREAMLRMKEKSLGADIIVNLKIETANLSPACTSKNETPKVAVIVYGTAITYAKS